MMASMSITREVLEIKLENPNSEIIRQMNLANLASTPALGIKLGNIMVCRVVTFST